MVIYRAIADSLTDLHPGPPAFGLGSGALETPAGPSLARARSCNTPFDFLVLPYHPETLLQSGTTVRDQGTAASLNGSSRLEYILNS
jgi:hypothetical protein